MDGCGKCLHDAAHRHLVDLRIQVAQTADLQHLQSSDAKFLEWDYQPVKVCCQCCDDKKTLQRKESLVICLAF